MYRFIQTVSNPYFLQEWGYQTWNHAKGSPISLQTVQNATDVVIKRLDDNFFRVRFDRLIPSEKNFLREMASLGGGSSKTGAIAELLKIKVTSVASVRANLIKKGMIYSPAYGELAFTVPLFDEFMIRAMPHPQLHCLQTS